MPISRVSRRQFLATSAVGAAALQIPYWATAQEVKAGERINLAAIGTGGRCLPVVDTALPHVRVLAVCDVDAQRLERAQKHYSDKSGRTPDGSDDYRTVLDRKDVQAVVIATPDHWHAKIAIEALQAGKHVYCEKPLALTIEEGQKICRVAKETGLTFQVGTQERSEFDGRFLQAVALVREGRLGDISRVWVATNAAPRSGPLEKGKLPRDLNWDRWLGPAPLVDYIPERCHYDWRWWYEYAGGKVTNTGSHLVDIAQWALGLETTSPKRVEPTFVNHPVAFEKGFPVVDNRYNVAVAFKVKCSFASGLELNLHDTVDESIGKFSNGILWEGSKGNLFVNRSKITGTVVDELKDNPLPEGAIEKIYNGRAPQPHILDFLDCIRSGQTPISDVWSHHRTLTTCHLANIAMRLGRPIDWDTQQEAIVGDDEAQAFVARAPRKGYELPG